MTEATTDQAPRRRLPLKTAGFAWGQTRVAKGLSLRQLEQLSGISRRDLSKFESGRMIPTGTEFAKVMAALEASASPPADDSGRSPT